MVSRASCISLILYCATGFYSVMSVSQPDIFYISGAQFTMIGEETSFVCGVIDQGQNSVIWSKIDEESHSDMLSVDEDVLWAYQDRFAVIREKGNVISTYTLKVKDITENDAGVYECKVSSGTSVITSKVELQVQLPSRISLGRLTEDKVTRFPLSTNKVTFPKVQLTTKSNTDEQNDDSPPTPVDLPVDEQNSPTNDTLLLQTVEIGQEANLKCRFPNMLGHPVTWWKLVAGSRLKPLSIDHQVFQSGIRVYPDDIYSTYILKIENVTMDDIGIYRCESATDERLEIKLQLQESPGSTVKPLFMTVCFLYLLTWLTR